jgi:hypothetical protein
MEIRAIKIGPREVSSKALVSTFGLFIGIMFWLVVASYPDFFFVNPLLETDPLRATTLTVSTIGWVLISTAPALILIGYGMGAKKQIRLLPFVSLLWPVSLLINHIVLYIQEGQWFINYLTNYPIFIATDILLPASLIAIWVQLRTSRKTRRQKGLHSAKETIQEEKVSPEL